MNTVLDGINGLHLFFGQFVNTDELAWVERMGSSLKLELSAPNNVVVIKVENTVENAKAVESAEKQKEPVAPVSPVKREAQASATKVVLNPGNK